MANLKDTLQKKNKSELVSAENPIDTKRLVRISFNPSKIDLVIELYEYIYISYIYHNKPSYIIIYLPYIYQLGLVSTYHTSLYRYIYHKPWLSYKLYTNLSKIDQPLGRSAPIFVARLSNESCNSIKDFVAFQQRALGGGEVVFTVTRPGKHTKNDGKTPCFYG